MKDIFVDFVVFGGGLLDFILVFEVFFCIFVWWLFDVFWMVFFVGFCKYKFWVLEVRCGVIFWSNWEDFCCEKMGSFELVLVKFILIVIKKIVYFLVVRGYYV